MKPAVPETTFMMTNATKKTMLSRKSRIDISSSANHFSTLDVVSRRKLQVCERMWRVNVKRTFARFEKMARTRMTAMQMTIKPMIVANVANRPGQVSIVHFTIADARAISADAVAIAADAVVLA
ncbi:MAG: hypothetical protein Q9212_005698 [Teloschistes hypoglaucus]